MVFSLLLFLAGCCGLQAEYVNADRETYKALQPFIVEWVDQDSSLSEDEKADFDDLLLSWDARIRRAEQALEEE